MGEKVKVMGNKIGNPAGKYDKVGSKESSDNAKDNKENNENKK